MIKERQLGMVKEKSRIKISVDLDTYFFVHMAGLMDCTAYEINIEK